MKTKVWLLMANVWWGDPTTNPDAWQLPPIPQGEVVYRRRPACVKTMRELRLEVPETERKTYSCNPMRVQR